MQAKWRTTDKQLISRPPLSISESKLKSSENPKEERKEALKFKQKLLNFVKKLSLCQMQKSPVNSK